MLLSFFFAGGGFAAAVDASVDRNRRVADTLPNGFIPVRCTAAVVLVVLVALVVVVVIDRNKHLAPCRRSIPDDTIVMATSPLFWMMDTCVCLVVRSFIRPSVRLSVCVSGTIRRSHVHRQVRRQTYIIRAQRTRLMDGLMRFICCRDRGTSERCVLSHSDTGNLQHQTVPIASHGSLHINVKDGFDEITCIHGSIHRLTHMTVRLFTVPHFRWIGIKCVEKFSYRLRSVE